MLFPSLASEIEEYIFGAHIFFPADTWKSMRSNMIWDDIDKHRYFSSDVYQYYHQLYKLQLKAHHSSEAVWESRWTSWAVRPNKPSGFRGRKDLLNRALALVTTCP